MTPAQEAKEFAAAHGFAILPNGRRYDIWTDYEGDEHQNHIAQVGGYPAALNAMVRYVEENAAADVQVISQALENTSSLKERGESDDDYAQRITETLKRESHAPSEILKQHGLLLVGDRKPQYLRGPGPEAPWRVWQRSIDGKWQPLLAYASRAEAVKYCRVIANIRSLHNLAREIRYEG